MTSSIVGNQMNDFEIQKLGNLSKETEFKLLIDSNAVNCSYYPKYNKMSKYDNLDSPVFYVVSNNEYLIVNAGGNHQKEKITGKDINKLIEKMGYDNKFLMDEGLIRVAVFNELYRSDYIKDAAKFFGIGLLLGGIPLFALIVIVFGVGKLVSKAENPWDQFVIENEPLSKLAAALGFIIGLSTIFPIILRW